MTKQLQRTADLSEIALSLLGRVGAFLPHDKDSKHMGLTARCGLPKRAQRLGIATVEDHCLRVLQWRGEAQQPLQIVERCMLISSMPNRTVCTD